MSASLQKPEIKITGLEVKARLPALPPYVLPMTIISSKTAPSAKIAFYLDQAAECGRTAASATLQNVRERLLRSELAWRKMASDIDGALDTPPVVLAPKVSASPSTPSFASFG